MRRRTNVRASRVQQIVAIAQREVTLEHASEFAPITNGPVVAVLGLIGLGLLAGLYLIGEKLRALLHVGMER